METSEPGGKIENIFAINGIGNSSLGIISYYYMQFITDDFYKLIEPLLPRADAVSFWVYAAYYESDNLKKPKDPTFEQWIYQSTETVPMTEQIFNQQINVIFESEVFTYVINGKNYMTYSQAVPPDVTTRGEIDFYLILLVEQSDV